MNLGTVKTPCGIELNRPSGSGPRPGILLIAAHFAPENVSGTHRSTHFARALHDAGWPVTVLTIPIDALRNVDPSLHEVFPYEDRVVRVPLATTIGDWYLALKRRLGQVPRLENGNPGTADHTPTDDTASPLREFFRGWSRFPDHYRGWYRPALAAGLTLVQRHAIGAVVTSGPPWTGVMAAYEVATRAGIPLVTDFRDPWTNTIRGGHPEGFWDSVARRRERRIVRASNTVLFNSPQMLDAAERAYARTVGGPVLDLVLNGTNAPRSAAEVPLPEHRLEIRHLGSLYQGRTVAPLLDALASLTGSEGHSGHVVFEQVGSAEEPLPRSCAGVEVRYRGTVTHLAAQQLMRRPGVLLVVQNPVFNLQIPTKMFEYLASGNPVLVLADEASAVWELAKAYPRCLRLDHTDRVKNMATLDKLIRTWGAGALRQSRAVEDTARFTKTAVGKDFLEIMERVMGTRKPRETQERGAR